MARYGNLAKVYVSPEAKKKYDYFTKNLKAFPSMVDLFHLSAALGIWLGEREPLAGRDELLNVYSIDKDETFETLLEGLHPELSGEERLEALQEYAEAGIHYLDSLYRREGQVDLAPILERLERTETS